MCICMHHNAFTQESLAQGAGIQFLLGSDYAIDVSERSYNVSIERLKQYITNCPRYHTAAIDQFIHDISAYIGDAPINMDDIVICDSTILATWIWNHYNNLPEAIAAYMSTYEDCNNIILHIQNTTIHALERKLTMQKRIGGSMINRLICDNNKPHITYINLLLNAMQSTCHKCGYKTMEEKPSFTTDNPFDITIWLKQTYDIWPNKLQNTLDTIDHTTIETAIAAAQKLATEQ